MDKKQVGRKALTPQEKKARQEFLDNEPITARTKRVLNPRIKRLLTNFDSLNNCLKSNRYMLTDDQKQKLQENIEIRATNMILALEGTTKKEIEDIL